MKLYKCVMCVIKFYLLVVLRGVTWAGLNICTNLKKWWCVVVIFTSGRELYKSYEEKYRESTKYNLYCHPTVVVVIFVQPCHIGVNQLINFYTVV